MIRLVALHSWHFTSRGIPRLVVFHVLWYPTPCGDPRLVKIKGILNFTREYLRVTMRGLSRMSEVTVELYRIYVI